LGFRRIPDFFDIRNDVESDHRCFIPTCVEGPSVFPLLELCAWVMRDIGSAPVEQMDLSEPATVRRCLVQQPGATWPTRVLALNFTKADWGLQRAICDVARRHRIPLLTGIAAGSWNSLEIGVRDRMQWRALSEQACHLSRDESQPEPHVIREWIVAWRNWADALLPIAQIADHLRKNI
jgi:hypothetical protein